MQPDFRPNESKFLDRLGRRDAGGQAQDGGPRAGQKGLGARVAFSSR